MTRSYEVQTRAGAVVHTFDRRQAAVQYARAREDDFGGFLQVVEVTYREPLRRTIPHHLAEYAA